MSNLEIKCGFYCGELVAANGESFPMLLPESAGGICVSYDDESIESVKQLIGYSALDQVRHLNGSNIQIHVFDYSPRPKFVNLAKLKNLGLYDLSNNNKQANAKFSELDEELRRRHQELLDEEESLRDYNSKTDFPEIYHLLLINLEDFPNEHMDQKRVKQFFESAREAGFYVIAFYNEENFGKKEPVVSYIQGKYPTLEIKDNSFNLVPHPLIEELLMLIDRHQLNYQIGDECRKSLLEDIQNSLTIQDDGERDFLSVPIATSLDGRDTINFELGPKSDAGCAFIAGKSGSGKTTLLNNIIINIAKQYSQKEINLYLMDYKGGIEFNLFKKHPNCKKLYLKNDDFKAAEDLLNYFLELNSSRQELFKMHKVNNIFKFNEQYPDKAIPWSILIIDEVHRLLDSYDKQKIFNPLLAEVAKIGRAQGLHLILSTQELGSAGIDDAIMSQMPLRISFGLNEADARKVFSYENVEAAKLAKYQLIYNSHFGSSASDNIVCRGNPPVDDIEAVLEEIIESKLTSDCLTPEVVTSSIADPKLANSTKVELTERLDINDPETKSFLSGSFGNSAT